MYNNLRQIKEKSAFKNNNRDFGKKVKLAIKKTNKLKFRMDTFEM